jgi:DNA-binding NarL/FixJ family response regulator
MKSNAETRILVVEDDPFYQRVLVKRLQAQGYQVLSANDGRDGMRAIVAAEPDLVLSDWMNSAVRSRPDWGPRRRTSSCSPRRVRSATSCSRSTPGPTTTS